MTACRQPWESSNWMDTSISSSAGVENRDRMAVVVEAALEPLPAWDGAAYSANYDGIYGRNPIAAEPRRRKHDRAPDYLRERALRSPDSSEIKLEGGKGGPCVRDYAALRPSNPKGYPKNVAECGSPRPVRHSSSPGVNRERPSEDGGTLTHVIRLHRTGSVEVERMRGSSIPEDTLSDTGEIISGRRAHQLREPREAGSTNARPKSEPSGGCGFYAEEERFWQARCPATTARSREVHDSTQTLAATVPGRSIGNLTSAAHAPTGADQAKPNDGRNRNRPSCGRVAANRRTRLEESVDRLNEPRKSPAVVNGCGKGAADVKRKTLFTVPSGVLGCEGSGAGLPLPDDRGNGARRMVDMTGQSQDRGDLLARERGGVSVSAADGVLAVVGETSLLSSGAVALGGDVVPARGEGVANSSRGVESTLQAVLESVERGLRNDDISSVGTVRTSSTEVETVCKNHRVGENATHKTRHAPPAWCGGGMNSSGNTLLLALGSGGPGTTAVLAAIIVSSSWATQRVVDTFRANSDNGGENTMHCYCHGSTTTGDTLPPSPPVKTRPPAIARRTRGERQQQPASMRNHLSDAARVRKTEHSEGALPCADTRDGPGATCGGNVQTAVGAGRLDCGCSHQNARRDKDGFVETLRTRGKGQRMDIGGEEEEVVVAGRVIELSKGIALRCLHLEQECLRRGRTQARLFQEQLRGVRQAAQDMTRRAIHAERLGAERRLQDAKKSFEETEAALLAKGERAEEGWKVERETFVANAAAAKSELEKVRKLCREEIEERRQDAEAALEKQKLELQRGWAEEKGRARRAAEDSLRRAEEGRARAEVEAALEVRTVQTSLEAQVRSWKSKAEAAERRAAEERDKRRELEAGGKGPLAQEMEKARQVQEAALRNMRMKCEEERGAHVREIERLEEEHRAHVLRVHLDKKKAAEAARRQREQEAQEFQAEAAAKAEAAATHAAAERTEALRRLRLAHDAEMRKAGRDVLRLERQLRLRPRERPDAGVVSRLKSEDSDPALFHAGSYSPTVFPPKVAVQAQVCQDFVQRCSVLYYNT
eukprot:jgi/Undpi1/12192/HiC_scaffold_5.g01868.m1